MSAPQGSREPRLSTRNRLLAALALTLAALAVYLATDNHVRTGDTFPARILPISILEEGDLDFDEFAPQAGGEHRLEDDYMFSRVDGHVVSYYSIVPGLLNLPAHWIDRALGRDSRADFQVLGRTTAGVVSALSVFFVAWILLGLCQRPGTAVICTLLYAFGTSAWSVGATALWQHGPSLLFLAAAFAALHSKRRVAAPLAGFLLGMAVWNRLPNATYALAGTLYLAATRPRELPGFMAGASLPALGLFSYSWIYWGSLTALGQGHPFALFGGPPLAHLAGLLLSPNRGFFVFTPAFLLALPMAWHVLRGPRRQPLLFALTLGSLGILLCHALWSVWWGGECFGYRMLTEMVPVWILLLALAWERWLAPSRSAVVAFAVLALLSTYIHFLGAVYYPSGWNSTPRSIDDDPGRAWDWRDSELGRLQQIFFDRWIPD